MHKTCLRGARRVGGKTGNGGLEKREGPWKQALLVGKCKNFTGEWEGPKRNIS